MPFTCSQLKPKSMKPTHVSPTNKTKPNQLTKVRKRITEKKDENELSSLFEVS